MGSVIAPGGLLHGTRGRGVSARTITNRLLRASGLKRCCGCRCAKPEDAFYVNAANRDGLTRECRVCHREAAPTRTTREAENVRHKRWRDANIESFREYARDREAVRRSRMGVPAGRVKASVVFERDEGICGICREPVDREDFEVDHIVPLALGGEHSYENVQAAHAFCNRSKGGALGAQITNRKRTTA